MNFIFVKKILIVDGNEKDTNDDSEGEVHVENVELFPQITEIKIFQSLFLEQHFKFATLYNLILCVALLLYGLFKTRIIH